MGWAGMAMGWDGNVTKFIITRCDSVRNIDDLCDGSSRAIDIVWSHQIGSRVH